MTRRTHSCQYQRCRLAGFVMLGRGGRFLGRGSLYEDFLLFFQNLSSSSSSSSCSCFLPRFPHQFLLLFFFGGGGGAASEPKPEKCLFLCAFTWWPSPPVFHDFLTVVLRRKQVSMVRLLRRHLNLKLWNFRTCLVASSSALALASW